MTAWSAAARNADSVAGRPDRPVIVPVPPGIPTPTLATSNPTSGMTAAPPTSAVGRNETIQPATW